MTGLECLVIQVWLRIETFVHFWLGKAENDNWKGDEWKNDEEMMSTDRWMLDIITSIHLNLSTNIYRMCCILICIYIQDEYI